MCEIANIIHKVIHRIYQNVDKSKTKDEKRCNFLMRKGCNPNREQKELLRKNRKNWEEWLYISQTPVKFKFRHKTTNEELELDRKIR